jgi:chloride channel protein, CIC family
MAEFPIPEMAAIPESQSSKKGQFGVALEPEIVRICGFAVVVGVVAGLVVVGIVMIRVLSWLEDFLIICRFAIG